MCENASIESTHTPTLNDKSYVNSFLFENVFSYTKYAFPMKMKLT